MKWIINVAATLFLLTGLVKLLDNLFLNNVHYIMIPLYLLYIFYLFLAYGYFSRKKWAWYCTPFQVLLSVFTFETMFGFLDILIIKNHFAFATIFIILEIAKGFLLFHPKLIKIFKVNLSKVSKIVLIIILLGCIIMQLGISYIYWAGSLTENTKQGQDPGKFS